MKVASQKVDVLVELRKQGKELTVPLVKEVLSLKSPAYAATYIDAANERSYQTETVMKESEREPLDEIFAEQGVPDLRFLDVYLVDETGKLESLRVVKYNSGTMRVVVEREVERDRPIEEYGDDELHPTLNVKIGDLRKAGLL